MALDIVWKNPRIKYQIRLFSLFAKQSTHIYPLFIVSDIIKKEGTRHLNAFFNMVYYITLFLYLYLRN